MLRASEVVAARLSRRTRSFLRRAWVRRRRRSSEPVVRLVAATATCIYTYTCERRQTRAPFYKRTFFIYIFPFTVPVVSTVPGNAQAFSESVLAKVTPAKKRRRERDGE